LVGIEPTSMTAVSCHNVSDRKAGTWQQELAPFEKLQFAVSDAGKGIATALQQIARVRHESAPLAPTLVHGLDLFHMTQDAERVVAQAWRRVESLWEKAETCDTVVERYKKQGIDSRFLASSAESGRANR
jgi:hypothetical protein